MAENFTIITDSSCDLPAKIAEQLHVRVIPLSVLVDGKLYRNYLDERDITFEEFYARLPEMKSVSTSAANVDEFTTVMESEIVTGRDVLYLGFSSGLSATYNAAVQAAKELSEKYPSHKIYTVDTLAASMGQGLLVYLAVLEKNKGKSIEEVRDYVESIKLNLCHWFTVDDLQQLKRGGRISAATALLGTMLNIKPVLHVDDAGKLISMQKARGRAASIRAMVERMEESAIDPAEQVIFISHGNCYDDAKKLADMVTAKWGCRCVINYVGPVIGAHSGQGTLALFFLGKQR
ncbi:MAG: DegV family protein [Clostridia bacterium]|nr:DegV family protein [Clostridia bacterium]